MGQITERQVLGMFVESLHQSTGMGYVDPISTNPIQSDQDSETYAWLGQVPQLSELKGAKQFDQLRETPWTVSNVEYQGGIAIPKKDILYDKTGQVQVRIDDLTMRAQAHWAKLISTLIINGASTTCYDGQYFFDTDHSEGDSGSQSNSINADISTYPVTNAGSTTEPSAGEMQFAIHDAISQILSFVDDKGEYVNENMTEFLVLTGLPLSAALRQAVGAPVIDRGDTNILVSQDGFRIRLEASPRFSSWTTKFAVFATQGNQKPIIRQQRVPNNGGGFTADGFDITTLWTDSDHYKKNNEALFSVETERAAAYGDWKKACLVTLT